MPWGARPRFIPELVYGHTGAVVTGEFVGSSPTSGAIDLEADWCSLRLLNG
jgi:hypothetical protein